MKIFRIEVDEIDLTEPTEYELVMVHHGEEVIPIMNIFDVPIHSKHDELFGSFYIFMKTRFFFFRRNIGFVEIKNSMLSDDSVKVFHILSSEHINNYITLNTEVKIIGSVKLKIRLNNILVHQSKLPGFNIFRDVLFKNKVFFLVSLLVPLMEGSTTCRLKCLKGLYMLIRMYFNRKNDSGEYEVAMRQLEDSKKQFQNILDEKVMAELSLKQNESTKPSQYLVDEDVSTTKILKTVYKKYKTKKSKSYRTILKYYYYAIGCYTNPLVMHGVDPQLQFLDDENASSLPIYDEPVNIALHQDKIPRFRSNGIQKSRSRILKYINLPDDCLLDISLATKVPHLKFKSKKTLIVSFRGTESANDIFSDINCDYIEFLDGYAHRGIFELAELFLFENEHIIRNYMTQFDLNSLKFLGHSLGAAIASVAGILWQQKNYRFKFRVIAFSPACCLSYDLAKRNKFIKSFVLGTDIFPRLSYGSVLDFKYLTASMGSANHLIKQNSARKLFRFAKKIKNRLRRKNLQPKLYCAGTLYHMKSFKEVVMIKKVRQSFFDSICVDFKFFSDHVPRVMIKKLKRTIELLEEKHNQENT